MSWIKMGKNLENKCNLVVGPVYEPLVYNISQRSKNYLMVLSGIVILTGIINTAYNLLK